jgi:23S rRNA (guanine745-N1)-methyltransferase
MPFSFIKKRMNEMAFLFQENKRIKSAKYVSTFESIFACPICKSSMEVLEFKSLVCSNHHTFDFAKQGYINLATHSVNTKYSKELFEARRKLIIEGAFFDPLSHAVAEIIYNHKTKETISILDTGCGEGSQLSKICDTVCSNSHKRIVGVGIDISKEGIIAASKNNANKVWAVADLAKTPFKKKQFDVILNILSPSNYSEFKRLMKRDGIVIK